MMKTHLVLVWIVLFACAAACDTDPDTTPNDDTTSVDDTSGIDTQSTADAEPELPPDDTLPYQRLSTYGFFATPLDADLTPAGDHVVPFVPTSPLFSDDTSKHRLIVLPDGEKITFDATERWVFPEGTFIVKTFYYNNDERDPSLGRNVLETRVFHLQNGAWEPYVYVWNEEQTEAEYWIIGKSIATSRIDADGNTAELDYRVPNTNQCKSCHGQEREIELLGPRTRQLNNDLDVGAGPENQLARFERLGLFDAPLPALDTLDDMGSYFDESLTLETRARNYLEANCAHCHNPAGLASPSGLKLGIEVTDPFDLGVCRQPVAAGSGSGGLFYDIVPGSPDDSIMIFRMKSLEPGTKMPELPTQTLDPLGIQLVSDWIQAMDPVDCGSGGGTP